MGERLPSLPALRVFEAAGRLLSFTRAAAELNVTQAAVSHQIRALEQQLGQPLFRRSTRRLELTAAGRLLLPAAASAFSTLERAVAELGRARAMLGITTSPFFGARWLAPRLARFAGRHPDIDVSVRHTQAVLDLAAEGLDLAIRSGRGYWPGVEAELLVPMDLVPAAAPAVAARLGPDARTAIAGATLLHNETREEWADWLRVAGLDPHLSEQGPVFDDEHVLVEAAQSGQGVALVAPGVVAKEFEAGALVEVADLAIESCGYYLVYRPGGLDVPKLAAFRDFLMAEAGRGAPPPRRAWGKNVLPPGAKML
ncbi:LysR substrate-binding domain-containing protein [Labrys wisconsinensis]|uniref:LysR family glycine cleavage system transcriptional activator n=1 Tax=Labrys wisconsinensis TaxID=425677 RepID=A0ABU0JF75_9HYPH|nr:LysR substrate-binding domain-containing protein [Labrys wisconsinensis]MDQ0472929.1 LysR family glycine cleavage system transcriptional activator [Labrys wisconsinensis]